MLQRVMRIEKEIGCVGGIEVAVMSASDLPCQLTVKLLGTYDSMTDIGPTFFGKDAERNALILANNVYHALQAAALTWEVPAEECDT